MNSINRLLKYQEEISKIQYTINILQWDFKISTPKGAEDEMIELITKYEIDLFNLQISSDYKILLMDSIESEEFIRLSDAERRYIYNLLRHYNEKINIPSEFYAEYSKAKNKCNAVWKTAKEKNDYNLFKPYLIRVVEMTKQYYKYINSSSSNLYDVMLNNYETGINSEIIDKLFDQLKKSILPLIRKLNVKKEISYDYKYTKDELINCAYFLLEYIGLDINKIKLDIYPHGFTEKMCDDDIRIAFKHDNNPFSFVSTIIHEGGHALFEQNIDKKLSRYENVTIDNLYALHESQSRFYENILGRNKNFWIPIYDEISKKLKLNISIDEFVNELNNPSLSMIRTESDELTYCMHIILRYEIERDLFSDRISVHDIPRLWNKKMKDYLNVDVDSYSNGLMQDVHWSEGNFGYFPSYLLGTIYDGMLIEIIEENIGNIDELLRMGKIKKITKFLIENIYKNGGAYTSVELLNKLYGKELSSIPISNYLVNKYNNKK